MVRSLRRWRIPRPLAILLAALLALAFTPLVIATRASANAAGNRSPGGFEIDGDLKAGSGVDWDSPEASPQPVVKDPIGTADATVFSNGSKEGDDPTTWVRNGSAGASGKADIGNVYVHSRISGGKQYAYVGFERDTDNGTVWYSIEFNQKPNQTVTNQGRDISVPDRSDGDLRLNVAQQGGGSFLLGGTVESWSSGAWTNPVTLPTDYFYGLVNDAPIAPGPWGSSVTLVDGKIGANQFLELSADLTDLGINLDCPKTGFSTVNIRSRSSQSDTSQMKDYATGRINIPSACSSLRINKRAGSVDGPLLGGATFTITPNPIPDGQPGAGGTSLVVRDNTSYDADPTPGSVLIAPAKPGQYTVKESAPPAGYVGDSTSRSVDAVAYEDSAPVTFVNGLGAVTFLKTDGSAALGGATFRIRAVDGPAAASPWFYDKTVVDDVTEDAGALNGAGVDDESAAAGTVTVSGLPVGSYEVTEIAAPSGYELDSATQTFEVTTTSLVQLGTFVDQPKLTDLVVKKVSASDGSALAGASFTLSRKNASGGYVDVASGATGADGTLTVKGQPFGDYRWTETAPPTGYALPSRASVDITIGPSNAGTTSVTTFADPVIGSVITIEKRDGTDPAQPFVDGAKFAVYRDNGADTTTLDPNADVLLTPAGGVSATNGSIDVNVSELGTYWVSEIQAPIGYDLDAADNPQSVTFTAADAGTRKTVVFQDQQKLTALQVTKTDRANGVLLSGATFALKGVTPERSCTTAADGTCQITGLAFGTYTVVETAAPVGYQLDTSAERTVTIDASNAGGVVSVGPPFTDLQKLTTIKVAKIDADTEEPLAGASFELQGGPTPAPTCSTGADGSCTFDAALPFGSYTVVETAAPTGYQLPTDSSRSVTIGGANAGGTALVQFSDPQIRGRVLVSKVDATSGAPLPGAAFSLYRDADGNLQLGPQDPLITTCTTGDNGQCVLTDPALTFGTYLVKETAAPTGYLPDPTVKVVSVSAISAEAGEGVTFSDARIPGQIVVQKYDGDSPEAAALLNGATFHLWKVTDPSAAALDKGSATDLGSCVSGTVGKGTCTFDGLDFGTYFVEETGAPTGFDLPAQPVQGPFFINAAHTGERAVMVKFTDLPSTPPLTVVKSVDKSRAGFGDSLHYTLTVSGTQAGRLHHVVVTDVVPTGTSYADGTALCPKDVTGCSVSWDAGSRLLTWTVDTLQVPTTLTLTFAATVDRPATVTNPFHEDITNTAVLRVGEGTPTTSNKVTTTVDYFVPPTVIVGPSGLSVVKTVDKTTAKVGDTLTYGVTTTVVKGTGTNGSAVQSGVTVKDAVPVGTTYVADSAECATTTEPSVQVDCAPAFDAASRTVSATATGDLAVGDTLTLTFKVTINNPATGPDGKDLSQVTNVALVSSSSVGELPSNEVVTKLTSVEGVIVEQPGTTPTPTPTPTPVVQPVTLPRTGAQGVLPMGATGLALLALGVALVGLGRRRRELRAVPRHGRS